MMALLEIIRRLSESAKSLLKLTDYSFQKVEAEEDESKDESKDENRNKDENKGK